jgi:glycosyltransferase involved in cell wall biosynthesis
VQWIQDIYPEIVPLHAGAWAALPLAPLRWLRNRAWRASALCVPVGEDMRATVLATGVAAGRVPVSPNWAPAELDPPATPEAVAAVRRAWGVGDGEFLVAYSGNLGRVHEFATVLDAAALLRDEAGVRFAFIGSGPRLNEVRRGAAARGLANVVFFPPQPRERLAAALAAPDAHLVTLRPGFERLVSPSKLAGVLAAGRPALFIGPPDSAIARQLHESGSGAVFAPGDAAGLAATIRSWRAEPAGQAERRAAARRVHERHFRLADHAAAWEERLRAVASGR